MTAPDPVREALEAAWRASTVDPDDAPEGVICYQREKAAVTIAAFLRAYAAGVDPRCIAGEWFPRFATAVERASKEPPHA